METVGIALSAAGGVLAMLALTWGVLRLVGTVPAVAGTVLLAASWPNATYLGLPVLEAAFGEWARRVAIQYDLFACFPLLMTVGVLLARHYGTDGLRENPLLTLLKVPPLWAALVAVVLNLGNVPPPPALASLLSDLGESVPPLMLLALGMSLTWSGGGKGVLPLLGLILVVQLGLQPAAVALIADGAGLSGELYRAVLVEAAMPTMVLGVVLCDRYGLDTALYAKAVTLTTAVSLVTTPLWFRLLA
jgi:hypothetical protein